MPMRFASVSPDMRNNHERSRAVWRSRCTRRAAQSVRSSSSKRIATSSRWTATAHRRTFVRFGPTSIAGSSGASGRIGQSCRWDDDRVSRGSVRGQRGRSASRDRCVTQGIFRRPNLRFPIEITIGRRSILRFAQRQRHRHGKVCLTDRACVLRRRSRTGRTSAFSSREASASERCN
jgi:hypothetical protein